MKRIVAAGLLVTLTLPNLTHAQAVRGGGNPYSSQLMTDPDAGTVQGIQRYGKPPAADPAQGSTYPYFVFPSVRDKAQAAPFSGSPTVNLSPSQQMEVQRQVQSLNSFALQQAELAKSLKQKINAAKANNLTTLSLTAAEQSLLQQALTTSANRKIAQSQFALAAADTQEMKLQEEFRSTGNEFKLTSAETAFSFLDANNQLFQLNAYATYAAPVFVPARGAVTPGTSSFQAYVDHQPLIQIKLRVVEVTRDNTTNSGSTLDYIRKRASVTEFVGTDSVPNVNGLPTLGAGTAPLNAATAASRFPTSGLIGAANGATGLSGIGGAGALVNLTTKHLNWIFGLLATELEADVLTAPELVTTNGESVEFVAGSKTPFNLGSVDPSPTNLQTSLTGANESKIQNSVFYKHVGSYLRVTPRIVNYSGSGKGRGESAIVADDVRDWNLLIRFLLNERLEVKNSQLSDGAKDTDPHLWEPYTRPGRLVPLEVKSQVLECVNRFTKSDLRNYTLQRAQQDAGFQFGFLEMLQNCETGDCNWKPEDCTIDIEVVARFSNAQTEGSKLPNAANAANATEPSISKLPGGLTVESDVRAIANILQIKNGTGLVMAGLLGESDIEAVSKIPVIGDLPVVGYLFRSKSVSRKKTEILIFIEANVLSSDPSIAREESSADLQLAKPYVTGGTLDNPLELGLQRAGLGNYLPPASHQESLYWARRGQQVNKIRTEIQDAVR